MTPPMMLETLNIFNANDLGSVLRQAGVSDLPKTKEGKNKLWLQMVGDPARINQALVGLPLRYRRALELLQTAESELRTQRYRGLLERAGILETPGKTGDNIIAWPQAGARPESAANPATFGEVLAALLKRGLIWTYGLPAGAPANARIGLEGGRYVYIPREVAAHLPPPPAKVRNLPDIPHVVAGSARTCQRDLYLAWSAAREIPFQTTNADLLRMADLKRLAGQLLVAETIATGTKEGDYRRIFFIRRLLSALGLLRSDAAP